MPENVELTLTLKQLAPGFVLYVNGEAIASGTWDQCATKAHKLLRAANPKRAPQAAEPAEPKEA